MRSNWWLLTLAAFEAGALAVALSTLYRKNLLQRWPALFSSLALELLTDAILTWFLFHPKHYAGYFYSYWLGAAVQSGVRFWLIIDVGRSFPGLGFLPLWVYQVVAAVGGSVAVTSGAFVFYSHPHSMKAATAAYAVLLNKSVRIAWLGFLAGILLCLKKIFRPGWDRLGAAVATGLVVRVGVSAAVAELIAHRPLFQLIGNGLDSLCTIAVLFFWVYAFERNHMGRLDMLDRRPIAPVLFRHSTT